MKKGSLWKTTSIIGGQPLHYVYLFLPSVKLHEIRSTHIPYHISNSAPLYPTPPPNIQQARRMFLLPSLRPSTIIGRVPMVSSQQTKMEHIPILGKKKTFQLPTKMTQNTQYTHPGLPQKIDLLQVYSQLASSQQTHLGGDFWGWF